MGGAVRAHTLGSPAPLRRSAFCGVEQPAPGPDTAASPARALLGPAALQRLSWQAVGSAASLPASELPCPADGPRGEVGPPPHRPGPGSSSLSTGFFL